MTKTDQRRLRVLITGARAPIALDLARVFHRHGHVAFMADSTGTPLSKKSNCCRQYFTLPSPRLKTDCFIEKLASIVTHHQIDMIIPTCEEVFFIAQFADRLPKRVQVFCDDFAKLKAFHNKFTFIESCQGLPIFTPQTFLIDQSLNLDELADCRYVLKRIYSRFATHTDLCGNKTKITTIQNQTPGQLIAQAYIEGTEFSSYGVAIAGKLTAHVCYHSIYRAGKGSGILFTPVQIDEIKQFIIEFVKKHNYTGQLGFDFIKDKQGSYYVLECNPRGTSGLHFLKDEPTFISAFTNPNTNCFPEHQLYKAIKLAVMCFSLPISLRPSKFKQLIGHIKASQDIIYDKQDKMPAFYQLYSLSIILLKSILTLTSPLKVSTYDIEYDG